jgi:hypothetical protein
MWMTRNDAAVVALVAQVIHQVPPNEAGAANHRDALYIH